MFNNAEYRRCNSTHRQFRSPYNADNATNEEIKKFVKTSEKPSLFFYASFSETCAHLRQSGVYPELVEGAGRSAG